MILASGVSEGIGISKAVIFKKNPLKLPCYSTKDIREELAKADYCVSETVKELGDIYDDLSFNKKDPAANVVNKYIKTLNNPRFVQDIKNKIVYEEVSAEYAIIDIMEGFNRIIKNLDDEYLCEKSQDIEEIKIRLLSKLSRSDYDDLRKIHSECIIVSEDLTPKDVLNMDPRFVRGIVTISGGPTSSAGIIARRKNIPAVTGAGIEGTHIKNGDMLIVDGKRGKVIVNPDDREISQYTVNHCL